MASRYSPVTLEGILGPQRLSRRIFSATHDYFGPIVAKISTFSTLGELSAELREAFLQAKLSHPWICQALDVLVVSDGAKHELVLCLEKMDRDLEAEVRGRAVTNRRFSEHELWDFLLNITDALLEAQEKGICHRDIKPSNIYLKTDGRYTIGDFGEAILSNNSSTRASIVGSLPYMAPSLTQAYSVCERSVVHNPFLSDVYSLGKTLLAMASLQLFIEKSEPSIAGRIQQLPYSEELKSVLAMMMEEEESRRPDFLDLSRLCKCSYFHFSNPSLKNDHGAIARLDEDLRAAQSALSTLALQLKSTLFNGSGTTDVLFPQLYLRKSAIAASLLEPARKKVLAYRFDYIPITEIENLDLGDRQEIYSVQRTAGENKNITVAQLPTSIGMCALPPESPRLILRRYYSVVTASELRTDSPSVLVRLLPRMPQRVSDGEMFSIGHQTISIVSVEESKISLKFPSSSGSTVKTFHHTCPITVGKSSKCTYRLSNKSNSATHAMIRRDDDQGWVIEDLDSEAGTWMYCHTELSKHAESREVALGLGSSLRIVGNPGAEDEVFQLAIGFLS